VVSDITAAIRNNFLGLPITAHATATAFRPRTFPHRDFHASDKKTALEFRAKYRAFVDLSNAHERVDVYQSVGSIRVVAGEPNPLVTRAQVSRPWNLRVCPLGRRRSRA